MTIIPCFRLSMVDSKLTTLNVWNDAISWKMKSTSNVTLKAKNTKPTWRPIIPSLIPFCCKLRFKNRIRAGCTCQSKCYSNRTRKSISSIKLQFNSHERCGTNCKCSNNWSEVNSFKCRHSLLWIRLEYTLILIFLFRYFNSIHSQQIWLNSTTFTTGGQDIKSIERCIKKIERKNVTPSTGIVRYHLRSAVEICLQGILMCAQLVKQSDSDRQQLQMLWSQIADFQ